jgi:thioredoxin-related protein
MTALVACETVLLALLVLLVAGLLRSHAEILRRLGPPGDEEPDLAPAIPRPDRRAGALEARDVVGRTLEHDAVKISMGEGARAPTLLAFLSSGCSVCERFWSDLRDGDRRSLLGGEVRLVALTKDSSHESPSKLRRLAGDQTRVVMSSTAWRDYAVPAAPYFVYVEGGRVLGEGSATGWPQIESLVRDALEDRDTGRGGEARTGEVDRVLAAAGIGRDHPSLYPGRAGGRGGGGGGR